MNQALGEKIDELADNLNDVEKDLCEKCYLDYRGSTGLCIKYFIKSVNSVMIEVSSQCPQCYASELAYNQKTQIFYCENCFREFKLVETSFVNGKI